MQTEEEKETDRIFEGEEKKGHEKEITESGREGGER